MPLAIVSGHEDNHLRGSDLHIDDGRAGRGATRRWLPEADRIAWRAGAEADDIAWLSEADDIAWRADAENVDPRGVVARRFDNARTLDCESRREHARRWSLHDEVHDQRVVSENHEDDKEDGGYDHDLRSDYDDSVDNDHADNDDDAVAGAAEAAAQHQAREQAAVAPARRDESHGGLIGLP